MKQSVRQEENHFLAWPRNTLHKLLLLLSTLNLTFFCVTHRKGNMSKTNDTLCLL